MFRAESEIVTPLLKSSEESVGNNKISIIHTTDKLSLAVFEGNSSSKISFNNSTAVEQFSFTEKYSYALFYDTDLKASSNSLYSHLQSSPLRRIALSKVSTTANSETSIVESGETDRHVNYILESKDTAGISLNFCEQKVTPTKLNDDLIQFKFTLTKSCKLVLQTEKALTSSSFLFLDNYEGIIRNEIVKHKRDIRRLKGRLSRATSAAEKRRINAQLKSKRASLSSYERFLRQKK